MNSALPSIFILLLGQVAGQNETFQKEAEPPLNCSNNDRARLGEFCLFIFYFSNFFSFCIFLNVLHLLSLKGTAFVITRSDCSFFNNTFF